MGQSSGQLDGQSPHCSLSSVFDARPTPQAVLELLLEHGADINERDGQQYTALMHSAQRGHRELVALLLHRGAAILFTQSVKR